MPEYVGNLRRSMCGARTTLIFISVGLPIMALKVVGQSTMRKILYTTDLRGRVSRPSGNQVFPIGCTTPPEKLKRRVMSLLRCWCLIPKALKASAKSTLTELPVSAMIRPTS